MTTNAFRHRPPEQCTLSKEDQQHILRISNNDQELLDELMAILRQLRPLPPRGASVRHTSRCDRRALRQSEGNRLSSAARLSSKAKLPARQAGAERAAG